MSIVLVDRFRTSDFSGKIDFPQDCIRVDDDQTTYIYKMLSSDREAVLNDIYILHMRDDHSYDWSPEWEDDRRYQVEDWPYQSEL